MSADTDRPVIDIQKVIGGGYNRFMASRNMFCIVKGSKGSKKSKSAAIKIVSLLMMYPQSNALCVRRVRDTLLDSVFADIGWAIDKLQVNHLWKKSRNPMRYIFRPNDEDYQTILFKGMDKAEKLASIAPDHGFLNFVWIEEAFELTNDEEFEKLQMSIRGMLPPGYFKQIIMTFNPWSELSWIKERFFDNHTDDAFVDTTTFRDNEFLDETDIKRYLDLYKTNPRRARVVCDGDWGVSEGLIYENWDSVEFDIESLKTNPDIRIVYGLDFGWSAYTAFVACAVDIKHRSMYIFDEWYKTKTTTLDIAKTLIQKGYGHEKIVADCAQPESIFSLRTGNGLSEETSTGMVVTYMLPNMIPGIKGSDSIDHGIQFLQSFFVHIHPRCRNFLQEISVYAYDTDSDGKSTGKPIDDYNHCLTGDTLVSTDHGKIPIKDIKIGDKVWSHLGLKEVTGTLIKEDQEIWEVRLANGTVISGTADHPMITTAGIKYLKDISISDEVIIWEDPKRGIIQTLNTSNMTDFCGTDIQNQPISQTRTTSCADRRSCTGMYGRSITGRDQKAIRSIISTMIPGITTYPTLSCCPQRSMPSSIPSQRADMSGAKSISLRTRINAVPGMLQRKATSGISSIHSILTRCKKNSNVSSAEKCSQQRTTDITDFVLPNAGQNGAVTPDSMTRYAFVQSVIRSSQSTDTARHRPVLVPVAECSQSRIKADVYDITVSDAYDFFANDVLVGDCMDAWRYAVVKEFLESGNGYVAEAGGVSGMGKYEKQVELDKPDDTVQVFARRVFSTSLEDYDSI